MRIGKLAGHEGEKAELKMTPMIDVVFLLLIFFMCATKFKSLEGKLETFLPQDEGLIDDEKDRPPPLEEIRIGLSTDADGEGCVLTLNRRHCAGGFQELLAHLRNHYRVQPATPVKIDSQRDVLFRYVVRALNDTRKAGFTKIRFAGAPQGGE